MFDIQDGGHRLELSVEWNLRNFWIEQPILHLGLMLNFQTERVLAIANFRFFNMADDATLVFV